MSIHGRFDALDGLRGAAALAVVVFHYGERLGHPWLPHAWVAVDTFFILSGFVLAHAYGRRIGAGMGFGEFAVARLLRLYPLYLAGLALGALDALLEMRMGRISLTPAEWWESLAYGLALLPHGVATAFPFGDDPIVGAIFPFNEPAWSLFYELVANAVFIVWLAWGRWMHRRRFGAVVWHLSLMLLLAGSLAAYLLLAKASGGLRGGWNVADVWTGLPRVVFGFFLGVALYRVYRSLGIAFGRRAWLARVGPLAGVALLVGFWRPWGHPAVSLFLLAPTAVLANAAVVVRPHIGRVCAWVGFISYPLYITHFPLFRLLWIEGDLQRLGTVGHLLMAIVIAVLVAWLFAHLDLRLRRVLTRALQRRNRRRALERAGQG